MRRFFICFLLVVTIFPIGVTAYECSDDDKARLKKFANNINYYLEDYNDNGTVYFKIIFTGISKEVKLYNGRKSTFIKNNRDTYIGESFMTGLKTGEVYEFIVQGYNKCLFDKLRIIQVSVPNFNQFYDDPICDDAKNYILCQKWVKNENTYDEFVTKVKEYIESNKNIDESNNNVNNKEEFNFYEFYDKYYFPTLIGTICLFALLVILWVRENKKNKL